MAHVAHLGPILEPFWASLGLFWATSGHLGPSWGRLDGLAILRNFVAILGHLRVILAETGFVYERSEGLTDFKRLLECVRKRRLLPRGRPSTILAETGFVYERSEGLAGLQKIIRVCQKEEIAA